MSFEGDGAVCRRCGQTVESDDYEMYEHMHFVCFHYEFEHQGDVDKECTSMACPSRPHPRGAEPHQTIAAGQFARIGVVVIESANGSSVVRLANGDDVVVPTTALAPEGGRVEFTSDPLGELAQCRECEWSVVASTRVSAEALFRNHHVSNHARSQPVDF